MTINEKCSPLAADLDHVLTHTEKLWDKLREQTVFLTGGTGFFGQWLLETFAEANDRWELDAHAIVLTRQPEKFRKKAAALARNRSIQIVRGDVRTLEADAIQRQLGIAAPEQISHIIHGASETSVPANRDQPQLVIETLREGTRRVLEFATQTGAQNFLLASSGAVYGEQPADMTHLREDYSAAPDVAAPLSAYGEGKRIAERLCQSYEQSDEMNCKIARCFAFVGPGLRLDAHYAIGNFIRDALNGNSIQVKGDGTPLRSYLYAADLAIWLWTILLNPAATGIYNVGSDEAHSIREIAECVSRHSPQASAVTVATTPDPRQPAARYVPDIGRAKGELGLQVWTPLDEAVRKTIEFHQQHREPSYEN